MTIPPTHIIIFLLTVFIYTINTGAYAARLAGVRTGHPTLAGSLFNVLDLGARGANALLTPLVGSITDLAANTQNTADLLSTYRLLLLAASVGTIAAALFIPTLSRLLARGVSSYETRRSLPEVVVNATSVQGLWRARHSLAAPRISVLRELRRSPFPKRFLLASVLVTAIAAVSNAATLYASALVPEGARTATSLGPMLSGFGMILTIFVINPVAAITVDEALRDRRPLKDVTYITVWQVGAQLVGTLAAQALLFPASWVVVQITRLLINL
ncbi:MAG: DUF2837 family protein [Anaerolineae bacterium]|nr:DUF2837 family protein [Anaerolineae bacterium]